jgi:hypothetical protein
MKTKVKLNLKVDDIISEVEPKLKAAGAATASALYQRGLEFARQAFGQSGFKNWNKGYKFAKVEDGLYIISIEGKLANMMEDGIETGEISKMIMEGNRAQHNKAEGKNYVDVPMHKDADSAGNISIQGQKFQVKGFKNADEMMKQFSKPDQKNVKFSRGKNVEEEQRMVSRAKKIEGLIKSQNSKDSSTAYMTIRRVGKDSVWPSSPYSGGKVLDRLDLEVEKIFATMIETFLGS